VNAKSDTKYRLRWALLAAASICLLAGLYWTTSPLLSGDGARLAPLYLLPTAWPARYLVEDAESEDVQSFVVVVLFLGLMLATQWMFLRPRRGFRVRMTQKARPLRTALAAAAFLASILTFGAVAVALELFRAWEGLGLFDGDHLKGSLIGLWSGLWLLWGIVFYLYWNKGSRFDQCRAMARGLIVGSVLELLVATGVYLWKSDEDDCWCARGSYTGLVFGATVMVWAFGPALVLLFLREARYVRKVEPPSRVD
jgi:hypothetical protein